MRCCATCVFFGIILAFVLIAVLAVTKAQDDAGNAGNKGGAGPAE